MSGGSLVPFYGYFATLALLEAAFPASGSPAGSYAITGDQGLVTITSEGWQVPGQGGTVVQEFTTGAAGTVTAGCNNNRIILNGVGTTFALTFPAAIADKQSIEVLFGSAVSVAFSVVGSGDGSTVKTVPSTQAAGTGIAWVYNLADTTWYRKY